MIMSNNCWQKELYNDSRHHYTLYKTVLKALSLNLLNKNKIIFLTTTKDSQTNKYHSSQFSHKTTAVSSWTRLDTFRTNVRCTLQDFNHDLIFIETLTLPTKKKTQIRGRFAHAPKNMELTNIRQISSRLNIWLGQTGQGARNELRPSSPPLSIYPLSLHDPVYYAMWAGHFTFSVQK